MTNRPSDRISGGERRGYRDAMDRMTKQLVKNGMDSKTAREKVRKAALSSDRAGDRARD